MDNYYTSQEMRKRADMQVRHLGDKVTGRTVPPILREMGDMFADIEKIMAKGLGKYVEQSQVGKWIIAQHGVGPVIAAGMLAHLDITRAPTVGAFWRFAGLHPSCPWEKNEKRPYNARLKQLCWHFGECAKRTHNAADAFYGSFTLPIRPRSRPAMKPVASLRSQQPLSPRTRRSRRNPRVRHRATALSGQNGEQIRGENLPQPFACDHVLGFLQESPAQAVVIEHMGHVHEIAVPMADEFFPGFTEAYYGGVPWREAAE